MVFWYILGGILLLFVILWLLWVRVEISFGQELRVVAQIGPKKLAILPKPEKSGKKKKKEKKKPSEEQEKTVQKKEKKKFPFTFEDIRSVLPVVFEALKKALRKIRRRMRVDPLEASIIFGHSDPVKVAQMYGWANTAVWSMMPQLEELIHIPHPHIHLGVDYDAFSTKAEGRVGIKLRVGAVIVIALTLAIPVLKWYLAWRKKNTPKKEETKTV